MKKNKEEETKELMSELFELSQILNTGIDYRTLGVIVNLVEAGVNPTAVAQMVKEVRNESLSNS
jgi:mitotic-spindle organizing protein 1